MAESELEAFLFCIGSSTFDCVVLVFSFSRFFSFSSPTLDMQQELKPSAEQRKVEWRDEPPELKHVLAYERVLHVDRRAQRTRLCLRDRRPTRARERVQHGGAERHRRQRRTRDHRGERLTDHLDGPPEEGGLAHLGGGGGGG